MGSYSCLFVSLRIPIYIHIASALEEAMGEGKDVQGNQTSPVFPCFLFVTSVSHPHPPLRRLHSAYRLRNPPLFFCFNFHSLRRSFMQNCRQRNKTVIFPFLIGIQGWRCVQGTCGHPSWRGGLAIGPLHKTKKRRKKNNKKNTAPVLIPAVFYHLFFKCAHNKPAQSASAVSSSFFFLYTWDEF